MTSGTATEIVAKLKAFLADVEAGKIEVLSLHEFNPVKDGDTERNTVVHWQYTKEKPAE